MTMGAYVCLEPIKHDGRPFNPGSRIDLTDEQAEPLLALDAIAPVAAEQVPDDQPDEADEPVEKHGKGKKA